MKIEVTPELVRGLWAHMAEHFDTRTVDRFSAPEMIQVGKFLDSMGIMEQEEFLQGYTTTIGRTIYTPWTIGEGSQADLIGQMRTCAHEHQHVHQSDRDGGIRFSVNYLSDSSLRAAYEAEAFQCNMEINHWLGLPMADPKKLAACLKHYACTDDDIRVTEAVLRSSVFTIEAGGIVNLASKVAIAWLELQLIQGSV